MAFPLLFNCVKEETRDMHANRVIKTEQVAGGGSLTMPQGAWMIRVVAQGADSLMQMPRDDGPGALCPNGVPEYFQLQANETVKFTSTVNVSILSR